MTKINKNNAGRKPPRKFKFDTKQIYFHLERFGNCCISRNDAKENFNDIQSNLKFNYGIIVKLNIISDEVSNKAFPINATYILEVQ